MVQDHQRCVLGSGRGAKVGEDSVEMVGPALELTDKNIDFF